MGNITQNVDGLSVNCEQALNTHKDEILENKIFQKKKNFGSMAFAAITFEMYCIITSI